MIQVVFLAVVIYLLIYYIKESRDKQKCPPGPIPIPFLGNLIQFANASDIPSLALAKFAKQYGEVFQLRLGLRTMVVPTSVEAITTIFSRPEAQGRDHTGSFHDRNFNKNLGVIFGDGPNWEKTKLWTIRNLRDYGFGKSANMESSIMLEIELVFQKIDQLRNSNKNVVPINDLFVLPVFKIMWQMIAGSCTNEDLKVISKLLHLSELSIRKGVFGAGIVTAYPFMRFIIPETTGHVYQMDFYKAAHVAAKDLLERSKRLISKKENSQPENLVEAFAYKMKEEKDNKDSIFTEENFIVIYMDLLQAGSDTNSAFLEAFFLFMVLYPDVQEKIVAEINQFGGDITVANREKMIYTTAAMWEVHRHTKVVQNLVTRRVFEDFYYKKYLIKKDTIMIANLHNAYFSEDIWDDPMAFKPERFIGENGQIHKLNCLMPFGVGKRLCPGEMLSHVTGFLYTTSILKKYKLSIVPGKEKPSQTMHEGFTSRPFPFEIVFSDRT